MLVLSRRKGESIKIGDGTEVFVVEIRGDRVRLGFQAGAEVRIMRAEIADRSAPRSLSEETATAQ